ncbi:conserved hypothetical protein [Xenorhabdus bovienii str. oregonense]|uniref:chorismate mutase n=1 Tax=Xenorhabdus bovienii str. oregonense TaxID=1398202 RepID=A0A077P9B8_XENBV|nr:chorismate mutase [Xenorhabdus bovienii]CDH07243.1 conserved hypothetical protein [Xenorhabdus bovienii str. oregonense]
MKLKRGLRHSTDVRVKAIRGAVQVAADTPEQIAKSTLSMMKEIISLNLLHSTNLVSFFFTITPDLTSELPPLVMREAGWNDVPTLCAAELPTAMMIPRVIRVLVHVEWPHHSSEPRHVYLPGTTAARPLASQLITQQ